MMKPLLLFCLFLACGIPESSGIDSAEIFVAGYLHGNPPNVIAEMKEAPAIEVISLDPGSRFTDYGERIHGWRVLGCTKIEDKAVIGEISEKILESIRQACRDDLKITEDGQIVVTTTTSSGDSPSLAIRFVWENSPIDSGTEIILMIQSFSMYYLIDWKELHQGSVSRVRRMNPRKDTFKSHSEFGSSWDVTGSLRKDISTYIEQVAGGDGTR